MNRFLLIILVHVCFVTNILAQSLSSIDLDFIKPDAEDVMVVSPVASFEFQNHSWTVGPALLLSYGDQIEARDGFKLTGLNIGYENFLHGKGERWNLFHSANLVAQRIKDEQESQFFDTNLNSFVPNEIVQVDKSFILSTSFGVLWNVGDKLSLKQSIGLGGSFVFRSTESNIDSFEDTFISQRWVVKTGISYRLN